MSETRFLSEMFNIQPPSWGLRGDPYLWEDMKQAFAAARARGVRVRVLTNSLASNDAPIAHAGYARHRPDLLTRLYPNSGTTTYRSTTPQRQGTNTQRQSATTQRQGTAPKSKGATTHREEAPSRNRRGNYHPHQGPTGSFVPARPHKKRK